MTLLFITTAYALYDQLNKIYRRKKDSSIKGKATDVISLNRTLASYCAFFANFLLGISYYNFDYYLVATRTIAIFILLFTFYEIFIDRKNRSSQLVLLLAVVMFITAVLICLVNREFLTSNLSFAKSYSIFATALLWQGYIHQIYLLRKSQKIGGLSVLSFQLYLIKEISMIAFALTLEFSNAWPLILMHGSVLVFVLILLWNVRQIRKKNVKIS